MRITLTAAVLAAVAAAFYCRALSQAPIYLTKDEASFAIQSHAIATTGRDINGRPYPLFFQEPGFGVGRDPLYIYATALVLRARPMDEGALRIPTTVAAVVSIFLTVIVARQLLGGLGAAAIAGLFLALTPAFFMRSRAALSVILPVPFQLLWLLCLLRYSSNRRIRELVIGTLALGVGLYSYLSMLFFVPLHVLVMLYALARDRAWRHAGIVAALLIGALVPLFLWQLDHPGRVGEIAASYRVFHPGTTAAGGQGWWSWATLADRADVYWGAFDPSRLFFSGESSLVDSTRLAGIFPLAYLILLPIGVFDFIKRLPSIGAIAVLVTLVMAPLPGAIIGVDTIGRYLIICPLAAIVAAAGAERLWSRGTLLARGAAITAVVSAVILFARFYGDYMTDWRERSAVYLGGNLKGALELVLKDRRESPPDIVYLSDRIPYVDVYWEFYRRANARADLEGRTRGLALTQDDWRGAPSGAVAIVPGGADPSAGTLTAAGWRVIANVPEFYGGPPSFVVLSRH